MTKNSIIVINMFIALAVFSANTAKAITVDADETPTRNAQCDSVNNAQAKHSNITNPDVKTPTLIPGDVNNDNRITMADANIIISYVLKKGTNLPIHNEIGNGALSISTPIDSFEKIADVNGDGTIDMNDARFIMQQYLNK